jgi:hypothetical protein
MLEELQDTLGVAPRQDDSLRAIDHLAGGRKSTAHNEAGQIQALVGGCSRKEALFLSGRAKLDTIATNCRARSQMIIPRNTVMT